MKIYRQSISSRTTGWTGSVANYAALPAATGTGNVYLVRASTGFLWNQRKGLYRDDGAGTWNRLSNATFQVLDNEAVFSDDGDSTRKMDFQLSGITAGNTRTITMADANVDLADIGLNNTHRTSDGSDHTFLDQSVVSGATPTLTGTNFTGIPAAGVIAPGLDNQLLFNNVTALGGATYLEWDDVRLTISDADGDTFDASWIDTNAAQSKFGILSSDAFFHIVSDDGGNFGSGMCFDQMDVSEATDFENRWCIVRRTSAGGNDLRFLFGTAQAAVNNDPMFYISSAGEGTFYSGLHTNVNNNSGGDVQFESDSENDAYFMNADNGYSGFGTTIPSSRITAVGTDLPSSSFEANRYSDNEYGPYFRMKKSRGTEASPTIVLTGDAIGGFRWQARTGSGGSPTGLRTIADIWGYAEGTVTGDDVPGLLCFNVNSGQENDPSVRMCINSQGRVGVNDSGATAMLNIDQSSTTDAIPVIAIDQGDVSEEFIRYTGTAAAATLTNSIVADTDVTTATLVGWKKVYVVDAGNQITDQAYYEPLYTLA